MEWDGSLLITSSQLVLRYKMPRKCCSWCFLGFFGPRVWGRSYWIKPKSPFSSLRLFPELHRCVTHTPALHPFKTLHSKKQHARGSSPSSTMCSDTTVLVPFTSRHLCQPHASFNQTRKERKRGIIRMASKAATILITGGCGYIGTHTIVCLLAQGYNVVVVDNLVNSSRVSLDRVVEIAGLTEEARNERLVFHEVDICDKEALRKVFETSPTFQDCIHFAGLKAVGESTQIPLKYYHNNLMGTIFLLELMEEFNCHSIVFSSSATVYGAADKMPITEDTAVGTGITNAYGKTKYMIEEILRDFYASKTLGGATTDWSVVLLRYFNPIGAHPSGKIGEDPFGIPNNLMPYVAQVAVGRREFLTVFGGDYSTPDGTGVRDYLHVMDLAEGHLSAIQYIEKKGSGIFTFNLGTGNGYSVLDMVKAMAKASGHEVKYKIGERRPGDIATCYADATLAKTEMGWEAKHSLEEMCKDLWTWQSLNPQGFKTETIPLPR